MAWTAGLIKRSEGRAALGGGYVSTPDDDLYRTDIVDLRARIGEVEPAGTLLEGDPELEDPKEDELAASAARRAGAKPAKP
jgi:hypothetical protein